MRKLWFRMDKLSFKSAVPKFRAGGGEYTFKYQEQESVYLITYKKEFRVPKRTASNIELFIISNAAAFKKSRTEHRHHQNSNF